MSAKRVACILLIYHVSDLGVLIVSHSVFKRFEKILLEFEVGQLFFFQKTHRKLTKRIQSKESNMWIVVTADLNAGVSN